MACATALAATPLIGALGASTAAAPVNSPSESIPVTVSCPGFGTATTITNSGHSQVVTWNPFFVLDATGRQTLIDPTSLNLTFAQNGKTIGSIDASKGGAVEGITCSVAGQSGSFTVTGSLTGNTH